MKKSSSRLADHGFTFAKNSIDSATWAATGTHAEGEVSAFPF